MQNRYEVVDNVDGQPSGYELVDTRATPPCTFAVGLREEQAVEIARRLNEAPPASELTTFTLEDALHAAQQLRSNHPTVGSKVILDFLTRLADKAAPESVIASDQEGYVIEGAYQRGFDHIDDNAGLLVVHANDLIKYANDLVKHVMAHRKTNKAANALKELVAALEEMGIADPDQAMGGADTVDVMCQFYPKLKKALS